MNMRGRTGSYLLSSAPLLLSVLCLLAGSIALAQTQQGFETAVSAFNRGEFAEAERLLRQTLSKNPDDVFGLNLLAVSLDRQQK